MSKQYCQLLFPWLNIGRKPWKDNTEMSTTKISINIMYMFIDQNNL